MTQRLGHVRRSVSSYLRSIEGIPSDSSLGVRFGGELRDEVWDYFAGARVWA